VLITLIFAKLELSVFALSTNSQADDWLFLIICNIDWYQSNKDEPVGMCSGMPSRLHADTHCIPNFDTSIHFSVLLNLTIMLLHWLEC